MKKTMGKETAKTTKARDAKKLDLIAQIKNLEGQIKDANVLDRVVYTLTKCAKDASEVTVATLRELLTDATASLTAKPVEALVKKNGKAKADPVPKDKPVEPETPAGAPKPKAKKVNKSKVGKKQTKDPTPVYEFSKKITKDTYTIDGVGTVKIVDDINNLEVLERAINEDEREIFFAYSWDNRDLRIGATYDHNGIIAKQPTSFPDDVDFVRFVYMSEKYTHAFGVSIYTEVPYVVHAADFEKLDGVTYNNGLEFAIFELDKTPAPKAKPEK